MLRRLLLVLPALLSKAEVPCAQTSSFLPTDEARMNEFAAAYNAYVESMREGKVDRRLWNNVLTKWRKLQGQL